MIGSPQGQTYPTQASNKTSYLDRAYPTEDSYLDDAYPAQSLFPGYVYPVRPPVPGQNHHGSGYSSSYSSQMLSPVRSFLHLMMLLKWHLATSLQPKDQSMRRSLILVCND